MSSSVTIPYKIIRATVYRATYSLIEATGSSCISNEMRRARSTGFVGAAEIEIVSFSCGHYVFSGQRHFASTIFADQILIVGWRLSKEAWPPGWFTFSHAMHERIGFLPLVSLLLLPLASCSPCVFLARPRNAMHRDILVVPSHLSQPAQRCPRNAYVNRIELPEP